MDVRQWGAVRRRRTLASRSLSYAWSWAMVLRVWSVGGADLAPTSSVPRRPARAAWPAPRWAGAGTGARPADPERGKRQDHADGEQRLPSAQIVGHPADEGPPGAADERQEDRGYHRDIQREIAGLGEFKQKVDASTILPVLPIVRNARKHSTAPVSMAARAENTLRSLSRPAAARSRPGRIPRPR